MFYSAKQYLSYLANNPSQAYTAHRLAGRMLEGYDRYGYSKPVPPVTEEIAEKALSNLRTALIRRDTALNGIGISKFTRPWLVVPELASFAPPEGDYGVGVEVEMGFKKKEDASFVAEHIADWPYLTLDYEGPAHPIEVTFAPELHSNLNNMLAVKYLDFLTENKERVYKHSNQSSTGTHINVSVPRHANKPRRIGEVSNVLGGLDSQEMEKYFGRYPYGYGYDFGTWVEWKLFNSQIDSKRLKQYINIAVELTKLGKSSGVIDRNTVREALERGFNTPITEAVEEPVVVAEPVKAPAKAAARRRAA